MTEENLILVDEYDHPIGQAEKMFVHENGLLHRAFSVFIFNSKGELLLHQRSREKYHSAGLWTNTCCSHPRYGEELEAAIERRLMEEMGLKCATAFKFSFLYKADFENGLTEHEFDHVYFGISDEIPIPAKSEVMDWKYVSLSDLKMNVKNHPELYTEWLKVCLDKIILEFTTE